MRNGALAGWSCALLVALLASLSGVALDYLARGIFAYLKIGIFEIYVSPVILKSFLLILVITVVLAYWLAGRIASSDFVRHVVIILGVFCLVSFAVLINTNG